MRELRVLFWRDLRMTINYFRAIPQNPKRALIFLLYAAYFGWIGWMNLKPRPGQGFTLEPAMITGMLLGYGALILLSNLPAAYQEMFTFFKPADVSIVFTAPMSPRLVLAGGFIKSTFSNLLLTLFLLILGARVMIPEGTALLSVIGVVVLVMLFNFSMQPFNFLVMRLKNYIPRGWIQGIVTILWVIPLLVLFYLNGFDVVTWLLDSRIFAVPILGWLAGLVAACYGLSVPSWPWLALFLGTWFVGIVVGCLYFATDYYEDVTGGVEQFAALRQRAKEGKGKAIKVSAKRQDLFRGKSRQPSPSVSDRVNVDLAPKNPWYWRALRISEKRQRFVYMGSTQLVLILSAGVVAIASYWIPWDAMPLPYFFNALVLYMTFLISVNQGEKHAFLTPKFVMSPGHPLNKLLGILRLDFLKHLLCMLLMNIILCFSKEATWWLLGLCFLAQMFVYLEIMASNLLVSVFLKNTTDVALMGPLLKVVQMILLVAPTAAVVGWVAAISNSLYWMILAAAATQLAIVVLVLGLAAWQAMELEISQ